MSRAARQGQAAAYGPGLRQRLELPGSATPGARNRLDGLISHTVNLVCVSGRAGSLTGPSSSTGGSAWGSAWGSGSLAARASSLSTAGGGPDSRAASFSEPGAPAGAALCASPLGAGLQQLRCVRLRRAFHG